MRKNDSSLTRVVPVFNALMDKDITGRSWLPTLLKLGSRSAQCPMNLVPGPLIQDHPRWWGKEERHLDPPQTLLEWLVNNTTPPVSETLWGGCETRKKRELLVARDAGAIKEAMNLLRGPRKRRAWYVLEGQSQPDACIETETLILVVEGKRTERSATTKTTWMPKRSQILRHMDAAWEIRRGRMVLGIMLVEGGPDLLIPDTHWQKEAEDQITHQTLIDSLPHRNAIERSQIAAGFLGVATWQKVCKECGLKCQPICPPSVRCLA